MDAMGVGGPAKSWTLPIGVARNCGTLTVHVIAPGYIATDHAANALGGDGTPDDNAKRGMPPAELATRIANAVAIGEPEVIAAPLNARLAIWFRALWPAAVFKYMQGKAEPVPRT